MGALNTCAIFLASSRLKLPVEAWLNRGFFGEDFMDVSAPLHDATALQRGVVWCWQCDVFFLRALTWRAHLGTRQHRRSSLCLNTVHLLYRRELLLTTIRGRTSSAGCVPSVNLEANRVPPWGFPCHARIGCTADQRDYGPSAPRKA